MIDDASRIACAEVLENIQSLNVKLQHSIQRSNTDNGPEFASRNNLDRCPFERMLVEVGLKHLYIRSYRPQTNGKVHAFGGL